MNSKFLRLISLFIFVILICCTCRKKDDGTLTFDYRIISSSQYVYNLLDSKTTFEYSNNKISKVTLTEYTNGISSNNEVDIITYPTATTIHLTTSTTQGNQSNPGVIDITLANNKVAESIMNMGSEKDKITFTYNSDGTVNKISAYYYTTTWILSSEITYTYTSGKLTQVYEIEYSGTTTFESKFVYSYTGDELKEEIQSYKQTGGTWVDSDKKGYTYTAGKISKITDYYKSGTTWALSSSTDYTYDSDGNLIKESSPPDRIEYAYEKGSGNYLLLTNAFGNNQYLYPTPHKKSYNLFR
jgi:hypothetical protein